MRLLIISYSYAPHLSPRSFRWTTLAEHWASEGFDVDVVAWGSPRRETRSGVEIFRTGGRIRTDVGVGIRNTRTAKATIRLIAKAVHDRTWKQVYWPDYTAAWVFPAIRRTRQLVATRRYDAIISVSLPFSSHLVALNADRDSAALPWLADIGDPFSFHRATPTNNHLIYHRLNSGVERRVFDKATSLSVTNTRVAELYAAFSPTNAQKINIISPLLPDTIMRPGPSPYFQALPDTIHAVYAGVFYRGLREPTNLLAPIEAILRLDEAMASKLQIHVFSDTELLRNRLDDFPLAKRCIVIHGLVPRPDVLAALDQATLLINVGNSSDYQLPSKLVEYVATGKPILNICSAEHDTSVPFLADHPQCYTFFLSQLTNDSKVREMSEFFASSRSRMTSAARVAELVDRFRAPVIAKHYLDALFGGRATSQGDSI
jgi:hypothetical protein